MKTKLTNHFTMRVRSLPFGLLCSRCCTFWLLYVSGKIQLLTCCIFHLLLFQIRRPDNEASWGILLVAIQVLLELELNGCGTWKGSCGWELSLNICRMFLGPFTPAKISRDKAQAELGIMCLHFAILEWKWPTLGSALEYGRTRLNMICIICTSSAVWNREL